MVSRNLFANVANQFYRNSLAFNVYARRFLATALLEKPIEPEAPEPDWCCGRGCDPCVWTVYWDELAEYNESMRLWKKQQGQGKDVDKEGCPGVPVQATELMKTSMDALAQLEKRLDSQVKK